MTVKVGAHGTTAAGQKGMWTWSLNWGQITPVMVIGSCPMTTNDIARIHMETGVTGLLSLQHDDCLRYWDIDYSQIYHAATQRGLAMERCPIKDFNVPDMRRQLPAAIRLLADMIARDHRVYVHCTAGLGRSAVVVLSYLVFVEGYSAQDAIDCILQGRPGSVPAWEAYHGCREDLSRQHRPAIERRAYELYQRGAHDNAYGDWLQAESEILRAVLTEPPPQERHKIA